MDLQIVVPGAGGLRPALLGILLVVCLLQAGDDAHAETRVYAGVSGVYDGMHVAIAGRVMTGYYERPGCDVQLYGSFATAFWDIVVWSPGRDAVVTGTASFAPHDGGMRMHVRLADTPPGCRASHPIDFEKGAYFLSRSTGAWEAIRVVSADTADVHAAPDPEARRDLRARRLDVLHVFSTKPGWVDAGLDAERVRGWIREDDLFAEMPRRMEGHCFPDIRPSLSPNTQHAIVYRWEDDRHRIYFRRSPLSKPEPLLDFLRSVCIHWSPAADYFALTNHAGSNVAAVDIVSTQDTSKRVGLSSLLPVHVRALVASSLHGYIEALSWNRSGLLVRVFGDRESDPKRFDVTVKCALADSAWTCLTIDTAGTRGPNP